MLRKIVVILTMLLCSTATQLYALGLGTVTVESALNQPLRVRIELLQLGDTRLQDIRVTMASGADFERFNIDRDGFLSNIRFSVESTAQGNVVILTSTQIVREPYLSFVLDTRWPNGRLFSEHTILLDLPVFDDQQLTSEIRQPISPILRPPSSAQATDAQPFVESSTAPAVSAPSPASSAASLQPEVISAEPVAAAEVSDAEVLDQVQEETSVVEEEPIEEVAEAEPEVIEAAAEPVEPELVEPETFETGDSDTLSGNTNRLRSGQVLRVPTLEEIQSIDSRDAIDEVTRQNQEIAEVDVQPLAAPSTATPGQDDQPQGQLSVVSSDDEIDADSGAEELANAENEALDQRIAELETQLAQRSEEADRARREREELDSRMADLEAQITAAQEIIRLQDIQLAQLQESLTTAAADAQLIAGQQAIEAALPVDSPSSLADDVMRILTGDSIFILLGIVLVVLLLVVLMLRRNRAAKTDDHDIDEIAEQDYDADAEDARTEDSEKDEAATEFQDYDPSDLDSELDDIIGVSDDAESTDELDEEEKANRESETKSFLDDLGIDMDSPDSDDEANEPEVEEAKDEPADTAVTEGVSVESDDVDMMFDLGGDDEASESATDESATQDAETFEFDLDDESNAVEGEAKDSEDLDIDTLEFEADAAEEVTADAVADEDEAIDLETFAFDPDAAASVTQAAETKEEEATPEADPNAVEFSFDLAEIDDSAEESEPASNEEVETFDLDLDLDLDLDDDAGDTVLEKADTEVAAVTEDDVEDFDFDLDEFEIEPGKEETAVNAADAGDDFLDLDAEAGQAEAVEVASDDEIEFAIDTDDEPEKIAATSAASADDLTSDDDLEFLSDDEVEIESVDDVEEVAMLSDDDETATKLELAYAYQKMGDREGATEILQEVIKEGSDEQAEEANKLLGSLDSKPD